MTGSAVAGRSAMCELLRGLRTRRTIRKCLLLVEQTRHKMTVRTSTGRAVKVICAVTACVTLGIGCDETRHGRYQNVEEARVAREYVPRCLSASASDLYYANDPDTTLVWIRATAGAPEHEQDVRPAAGPLSIRVRGHLDWWPPELADDLNLTKLHASGWKVFECIDGDRSYGVIALSPDGSTFFSGKYAYDRIR